MPKKHRKAQGPATEVQENPKQPVTEVQATPQEESEYAVSPSEDWEDGAKNVSTSSSEVVKLTLRQFLQKEKVHPGLLASFRIEAQKSGDTLEPRTLEEWKEAFNKQSKRKYM